MLGRRLLLLLLAGAGCSSDAAPSSDAARVPDAAPSLDLSAPDDGPFDGRAPRDGARDLGADLPGRDAPPSDRDGPVDADAGDASADGSSDSFETDPTPVKMTDYWPTTSLRLLYRRPDGSIYLENVIDPDEPNVALMPAKTGSISYRIHQYMTVDHWDQTASRYDNTWHMRNGPDGEVSEVADSFAPEGATCSAVCYVDTAYYYGNVIGHGRPGGHVLGEATYAQFDIDFWYGPAASPPVPPAPPTEVGWSYSATRIGAKHDAFTPSMGNSGSGFGAGSAPTYQRVIKMRFQHGTRVDPGDEPACANQPVQYPHADGYSSFWEDIWYAPGVGPIQRHILFYEASCCGYDAPPSDDCTPAAWRAFLDTVS